MCTVVYYRIQLDIFKRESLNRLNALRTLYTRVIAKTRSTETAQLNIATIKSNETIEQKLAIPRPANMKQSCVFWTRRIAQ
ncbi:hypothetical protein WN51_06922 [Melipona quadrifasciata]|uniref:Uncharacterized protein n=1 Tax=Melipona quadrifasciata TaxID=166423 RepID=A0A0M8ZQG1_9HYME|nr:hypothetical protein WN51_06922 [Melipona quadrifasciata]